MGYYVVYAPDDTVIAISLFNNFAAAEESNKRALAWIEHDLAPLLDRAGDRDGRAGDRAHAGLIGDLRSNGARRPAHAVPVRRGRSNTRVSSHFVLPSLSNEET